VAGALPEHARGEPVEVWFQDAARVGQQGTLTRVWARRGTRPRDRRYAWAYLFGAVCPERAVGAALVLPYADTEATGLHLAEIGRRVAPGAHAVVVLDGAGWHGGGDLAVPENLSLLPLPRYSPELNPVENVWEYLRQNKLGLPVWPDDEAIVATCREAWNWLAAAPDRLGSITRRECERRAAAWCARRQSDQAMTWAGRMRRCARRTATRRISWTDQRMRSGPSERAGSGFLGAWARSRGGG
jgi:putative transposase